PAEIQSEIGAVAIHAVAGTDVEKDAFGDSQGRHNEKNYAVLFELRKTTESCLTKLRRAASFNLGAIMMPESELADFGCWGRARVNCQVRRQTGCDAGCHTIN